MAIDTTRSDGEEGNVNENIDNYDDEEDEEVEEGDGDTPCSSSSSSSDDDIPISLTPTVHPNTPGNIESGTVSACKTPNRRNSKAVTTGKHRSESISKNVLYSYSEHCLILFF